MSQNVNGVRKIFDLLAKRIVRKTLITKTNKFKIQIIPFFLMFLSKQIHRFATFVRHYASKKRFLQTCSGECIFYVIYHLSRIMRKTDFSKCEKKGTDQLCSNCTADQHLCFCYMDGTNHPLLIPKISRF